MAATYIREFCIFRSREEIFDTDQHWSFECVSHVLEDPEAAWTFVLEGVAQLTSVDQAYNFSAGPFEEAIAKHGAAIIDRLEIRARQSPRFRMVLTGVWPLGNSHTLEWKRVEKARLGTINLDDATVLPEF